jgi:hypothetical protein
MVYGAAPHRLPPNLVLVTPPQFLIVYGGVLRQNRQKSKKSLNYFSIPPPYNYYYTVYVFLRVIQRTTQPVGTDCHGPKRS